MVSWSYEVNRSTCMLSVIWCQIYPFTLWSVQKNRHHLGHWPLSWKHGLVTKLILHCTIKYFQEKRYFYVFSMTDLNIHNVLLVEVIVICLYETWNDMVLYWERVPSRQRRLHWWSLFGLGLSSQIIWGWCDDMVSLDEYKHAPGPWQSVYLIAESAKLHYLI
jgi:hypothetical protein